MGYFNELPNIVYQSPLSHKNSSGDYIVIKNIFRRTKLADYVRSSVTTFNKFVIGDGDTDSLECSANSGILRSAR